MQITGKSRALDQSQNLASLRKHICFAYNISIH